MPNHKPQTRSRESLLRDLYRVQDLIDKKEYSEAVSLAASVRIESRRTTGRDSANAAWLAAIAADYAGEFERAFAFISDALAIDPVCLAFDRSFDIIVAHTREALLSPERDPADPAIERLYRLLLNAAKVDTETHLALVRHYAATGRVEEAFKTVDALTELFPTCEEAWAAKMTIALRLGREDVVRECEVAREAGASSSAPAVNMSEAEA
jgi:tetratricopeptide (TPR) repeat protein